MGVKIVLLIINVELLIVNFVEMVVELFVGIKYDVEGLK